MFSVYGLMKIGDEIERRLDRAVIGLYIAIALALIGAACQIIALILK